MNYANAKIYRIESPTQPELGVYYGATCQPLAKRMALHRCGAGAAKHCRSAAIIAAGDAIIVLVELCPVASKEELNAREAFWIRNNPCVNKQIPGRTVSEYTEDTRSVRSARCAIYYADNKKAFAIRNAAYRKAHQDEKAAKSAVYREVNKEKISKSKAAYYAANREEIIAKRRASRADKKAATAAV